MFSQLYPMLVILPIAFGIYACSTASLPVSSKRALVGEDARTYGRLFIVYPIVIATLTLLLISIDRLWLSSAGLRATAFYVFAVGLPLGLALILDRAQKRARRAMFEKQK